MNPKKRLFVGCIVALVTTSFGFIVRAFLIGQWGETFNLSESELGSLQGAGLYPFALSILGFSLIIDKLGYGKTMALAWILHVVSAVITMTATGYNSLYLGTFLFALANGAVEAAINPVTATIYSDRKTHYLNILHAGWPGGLVLGGILAIALSNVDVDPDTLWRVKIGLFLLPAVVYGVMLLGVKFPQQERVAAGVSYKDMMREFGWGGFLVCALCATYGLDEIVRVFGWTLSAPVKWAIALIPTVIFGFYIRTIGRPLFVLLTLVMVLLAATELGTDSWIATLMTPVLAELGPQGGNWMLVYTSLIMFILRFFAGPIVERTSPLGLLAICSLIACLGLTWIANAHGAFIIFLAATLYGVGKTFFWPTMLGVVAEQFPKGGALTLNAISGIGMISVGVLSIPFMGTFQDNDFDQRLEATNPAIHQQVMAEPEEKYLMTFRPLDREKVAELSPEEKTTIDETRIATNRGTLAKVAVLPGIMLISYLGMILWFKSKGGYKAVSLDSGGSAH